MRRSGGLLIPAIATLAACVGTSGGTPGSGGPAETPYEPAIDPARFVDVIDNPYLPYAVGSTWVYESDDGSEVVTITVTGETREIMGVTATVVKDEGTRDGRVIETTYDWFAQDAAGTVWYFGEDTEAFLDGQSIGRAGSWEGGVDGSQPGIVMPADPEVGFAYRQEFYRGHAEDMGRIVETGRTVELPIGTFAKVLVTEDWTPLEPGVLERKYYAPGIGLIMEEKVEGGGGRLRLSRFEPAG